MPSVYCPTLRELNDSQNRVIRLEGEEFHHLVRVLHHRTGDRITLNSGKGLKASAIIIEINKDYARLQVQELALVPEIPTPFAIAFALLKNRRDENIVEKCTELGVNDLFPFTTEYTVRRPANNTLERFGKVALAAIKQCDNAFLPRIHAILDLIPTLTVIRDAGYAPVLCSERCPDIWLYDLAPELLALPCFIIGPEGGFSKSEFDFLGGEGLPEISIGYLITRADTAAVSIAAQWLAYANQERAKGTI